MKPIQIRFKKPMQIVNPGEFANAVVAFHRQPCDAKEYRENRGGVLTIKTAIRFRYAVDFDLWLVQFRVSFKGRWGFWNPNGKFLWRR